ncbi:MAG: GtrA family protein [Henriciella sp.]|mmetsp:Transcript_28713/g.36992  ORF Transcript_28713/g.36992 Transcript_28713/m.36992 type:complete len:131 (+) Transcript_28713:17-409(+)
MTRTSLSQFGRFAVVGGLGFIVDSCFTLALIHRGIDPYTARIFAIALAMMVTWRLNRALTFDTRGSDQAAEGIRYFTVAIIAAVLNYMIYAGLLFSIPMMPPLLAIIIAIGSVTLLSFVGYRHLVFKSAV